MDPGHEHHADASQGNSEENTALRAVAIGQITGDRGLQPAFEPSKRGCDRCGRTVESEFIRNRFEQRRKAIGLVGIPPQTQQTAGQGHIPAKEDILWM